MAENIDIKQLIDGETPFYPQTDIHGLVNNGEYAIDDEPAAGSDNLVKSGGVYNSTPTIANSYAVSDLDISDDAGNVLARFAGGHLQVKNFSSADALDSIQAILSNIGFDNIPEFSEEDDYTIGDIIRYEKYVYVFTSEHTAGAWDETEVEKTVINTEHPVDVKTDNSTSDLDISDENGNVLARFENGHIKTKNFNSEECFVPVVYVGGVDIKKYFINLQGKKIMLYGDSISSSDYSFYKDALEEITNAEVYNGGFSGYTTAQLASATCLSRAINYNPDVVLILVGGNDMGNSETVGTFGTYGGLLDNEPVVNIPSISSPYSGTKFIEAVAYITQYLTYHIGGFRHNSYLDGDCTDVGSQLANESDLDNIIKPIVVLCTTIPQQRYDSSSDWSSHTNSKRKADACREVAQLLNIPLLDFATRTGFAEINETYWQSPTDKTHNKGTYMMDGLHPNKFGYRRMARLVYDFLTPYFIN